MLAVHDLGPVAARKAQFERPVVLAERTPGDQVEQGLVLEVTRTRRRVGAAGELKLAPRREGIAVTSRGVSRSADKVFVNVRKGWSKRRTAHGVARTEVAMSLSREFPIRSDVTAGTSAIALDDRSAATRAQAMWPLYAILGASLGICIGLIWDISWHRSIMDTFWSPPHVLEQLSALVAGTSCGWLVLTTTFRGTAADHASTVRFWGFRGPLGAWLCIWGTRR